MAKKVKEGNGLDTLSNKGVVKGLMARLQQGVNSAYKQTHFSQANNSDDLKYIKTSLDNTIDSIIGKNEDEHGMPSISSLIGKMQKGSMLKDAGGRDIDLTQLFEDSAMTTDIISSLVQNNQIKEYDSEIDIICKYMPSLDDALDAKKDNVLSADHYNKDFLNIVDMSRNADDEELKRNFDALKAKYNLVDKLERYYSTTAKYGEGIIYNVPYKKALAQLMARRKVMSENGELTFVNESGGIVEDTGDISFSIGFETTVLNESTNSSDTKKQEKKEGRIDVQIDTSGVLFEAAKEVHDIYQFNNKLKKSIVDFDIKSGKEQFEAPESSEDLDKASQDGFISLRDKEHEIENKLNTPGCILKKLDRDKCTPLKIEDMLLGFYYIETFGAPAEMTTTSMLTANKMFNRNGAAGQTMLNQQFTMEETILKNISNQIADKLNTEFIAANPNLKEEIYRILKYDSITAGCTVKISFLPPEDVTYMYFKMDEQTKRGVSDLDKALYPAKIYSSVDTTNIIGILTKSQDKRAIYVKNQVDTNTSGVLLNTINQIKRGNFGSRELANIKNLLNITGRFNDYIIPLSPSGDAPIQFEMMPGQNIDTKEDLLNRLEEQAVNSTDVPFEYIQSRKNVDYAVRLSMSSGKFLRKVYKRQSQVQVFFTEIVRKLYKSEYGSDPKIDEYNLQVILPPPTLLNILNTNQMFSNLNDLTEFLIPIIYPDNSSDESIDRKRALFAAKVKTQYLGTTIDLSNINMIKLEVDSLVSIENTKAIGADGDSDE